MFVNLVILDCLLGGLFSGLVMVVSGGLVDIGLGIDIGGFICVFVSYNGLFGLCFIYGFVDIDGLVVFVLGFDIVGIMMRDLNILVMLM